MAEHPTVASMWLNHGVHENLRCRLRPRVDYHRLRGLFGRLVDERKCLTR
jgi:hypothetical protein